VGRRRDTDSYEVVRQDGVELLMAPDLAKHTRQLSVGLRRFWFLRSLKAQVELSNGLVLGRRVS
jgi:hypothetical protein